MVGRGEGGSGRRCGVAKIERDGGGEVRAAESEGKEAELVGIKDLGGRLWRIRHVVREELGGNFGREG